MFSGLKGLLYWEKSDSQQMQTKVQSLVQAQKLYESIELLSWWVFGIKPVLMNIPLQGTGPYVWFSTLKIMHAGMGGWVEVFTLNRVMKNMKNVPVYGHTYVLL